MISRGNLKPNTLGHLHSDKNTGTASISVMNVSSYKLPIEAMLEDMEVTLVHELVHLELSPLPLDEASRSAEEYTVNQLTEALLQLDRENQETPPQALSVK